MEKKLLSKAAAFLTILFGAWTIYFNFHKEPFTGLRLFGGQGEGLEITNDGKPGLTLKQGSFSGLYKVSYWLENIGNRAIEVEDYRIPLSISAESGIVILGVGGSDRASGEALIWSEQKDQNRWILKNRFLNPGDRLDVTLFAATSVPGSISSADFTEKIRWEGKIKEAEMPAVSRTTWHGKNVNLIVFDSIFFYAAYPQERMWLFLGATIVFYFLLSTAFLPTTGPWLSRIGKALLYFLALTAAFAASDVLTDLVHPLPIYNGASLFGMGLPLLWCAVVLVIFYFVRWHAGRGICSGDTKLSRD